MRNYMVGLVAAAVLASARLLAAQQEDDLFTKLDGNKDGFVSIDEVPEAQRALFERLLRKAGKEEEKKLNRVLFQAALKSDDAPKQPLGGGQGFPGRPGAAAGQLNPREVFSRLDANKDGKLSKDELPPGLQERFARLDTNGDGALNEEEFSKAAGVGQRPPGAPPAPGAANQPSPRELEALFDRTDANSDGKVTKDEVPEERRGIRALFERFGSDSITKEQFVRGMTALAQAGGQPPAAPARRPDGAPRPAGAPQRRPEGQPPPGGLPGAGLFAVLDTDHDGQLSTAEIVAAGSVLLKLDRNGDGKLTPEEVFGGPPGNQVKGRPGEGRPSDARPADGRPGLQEMLERIKAADTNKDGKLSKDEAPDRLKENFERIDANGDGFIDETEVRQMFERLRDGAGNRPEGRRPEGARPGGDQPRRP
jgi:Ca2+-binding EF-hand superfamily protein